MMGNSMKGFIFTLDAVFALIVASVGVSILLYAHFSSPAAYHVPVYEATSILQNLLQTPLSVSSLSSVYGLALYNASQASAYTWPNYGNDASMTASAAYGPQAPTLLYTFNAPSTIAYRVSVDQGTAAFAVSTNEIYAINATTGNIINGYPVAFKDTSSFTGSPLVYKNEVIYANWTLSSTYVNAVSITNGSKRLWSTSIGVGLNGPIQIEGGYLVMPVAGTSVYWLNPNNGTFIGSSGYLGQGTNQRAPNQVAYSTGEYIVSTSTVGSTNYLESYTTTNGIITRTWMDSLTSSATTSPAISGNIIAVGSGTTLYYIGLNGTQLSTATLDAQIKSVAASGSVVYAETANAIYGMTAPGGKQVMLVSTPTQNWNGTLSIAQDTVYTVLNDQGFRAYGAGSSRLLWTMNLSGSAQAGGGYAYYSNAALAYGNAYIPDGSELFVIGSYKPRQGDSILQTLATMYLTGHAGRASQFLTNLYNTTSTNVGIFINNTFGPSLKVAKFGGVDSCGAGYTTSPINNLANYTIAAWIYPTARPSTSGIYSEGVPGETFIFYLSSTGALTAAEWNVNTAGNWETSSSSYIIPLNKWSFVAMSMNKGGTNTGAVTFYDSGQSQITTGQKESHSSAHYLGIGCNIGYLSSQGIADFNGLIADLQVYNSTVSQSQMQAIYSQGPYGVPTNKANLVAWWPLLGSMNDYGPNYYTAIPSSNVVYAPGNYLPSSLQNSYQVSRASIPLSLNVNGINNVYNVSVVVWR